MSTGSKEKKQRGPATRLPSIPIQEISKGYRSDVCFWRGKLILERNRLNAVVTMQVFQKKHAILCGSEVLSPLIGRAERFFPLGPLLRDGAARPPTEISLTEVAGWDMVLGYLFAFWVIDLAERVWYTFPFPRRKGL
ncbi:MAG: hypothetical protein MUO24_02680 [Desulfobacterales bacterium]|nr:hypothetical protein [Desulfobacterales bacterium]